MCLLAVVWAAPGPAATGDTIPGLPAQVVLVDKDVALEQYPAFPPNGNTPQNVSWRVVSSGSGNPFENYLATTSGGRLLNWGGTYLTFSDDQGLTWNEVRPIEPLLGAEGAVTVAPNGDVVGVTWDPYTGDHLLAFKYDTDGWRYTEVLLHTPFYDRPWIAVVPGPFTVAGQTVPYISILRGGWPSKEVWYLSLDGLNYVVPSSKLLDSLVPAPELLPLAATPAPWADWTQPHVQANVTPLNGGGGLAGALDGGFGSCLWKRLGMDLRWRCISDLGDGVVLQDSDGYLHLVSVDENQITYKLSTNGGGSWLTTTTTLPTGYVVEEWDAKASGAHGTAVVAVHAHTSTGTDQDLVYKYSVSGTGASLQRRYHVGLGDYDFGSGVNIENFDRFDFSSVAILPSGKIAVSFGDSEHVAAALAIEL